ncbi:MAG: ADP-ribosyltransferase [Bacteroidales bacterium]|nr:ADP-ribosyltransferase [Bacteroidales bacterium]
MKIPTPEERAKALLRIEKQTSREVAKCFSDLVDRVTEMVGSFPPGTMLHTPEGTVDIRSNPAFARLLDKELTKFSHELDEANERGVTRAWTLSDYYGDIDIRGYLKRMGATTLLSRYTLGSKEAQTAHRAEAMRAFLDRRDRKGFTISGRVWRTAEQAMQHIETSLSEGLAEGRSAAELSRTIRQDLREPDKLFRRVRDKNGILQLSKSAKAYHPGAGVYRSSYKNALRLTRTEINVSYAEADFERWQRLDFVVGYEVRLSNNHTCNGHPFTDICDELAGKYPKWFKFTKWHPQCRCVCLAIFDDDPGAGEVRDVPANFKQWVTDNQPRLDRSIKKGTAPYWVRDNFSKQGKLTGAGRKPATPRTAGGGSKPPKPPVATTTAPADPDEDRRRRTLERAKARHEARTPEEVQKIHKAWSERRAVYHYGENMLKTMGGISDISTKALETALRGGDPKKVLSEARALYKKGKEITTLKGLPHPLQVAKEFSAKDAKTVNDAVLKQLQTFKGLPTEGMLLDLKEYYVFWIQKPKYGKLEAVARNAFEWHYKRLEAEAYWTPKKKILEELSSINISSNTYKKQLMALKDAITSQDRETAESLIEQLEKTSSEKIVENYSKIKPNFGAESYTKERKDNAIWCQSADESMNHLFQQSTRIFNTTTEAEQEAMFAYTKGSGHINRPLSGYDRSWNNFKGIGKVPLDNEDVNTPRQIKDLTNLIQRSPMLDDIWVERGVDSDGLKGFLGVDSLSESSLKSMIGKTVEEPAFTSCGAAKGSGFNGNVLNIYCPKGTRMYYFDGRSAYATENEILIQRGTKFRITKVETDGGKFFIDLEVVGQI